MTHQTLMIPTPQAWTSSRGLPHRACSCYRGERAAWMGWGLPARYARGGHFPDPSLRLSIFILDFHPSLPSFFHCLRLPSPTSLLSHLLPSSPSFPYPFLPSFPPPPGQPDQRHLAPQLQGLPSGQRQAFRCGQLPPITGLRGAIRHFAPQLAACQPNPHASFQPPAPRCPPPAPHPPQHDIQAAERLLGAGG